MKGGSEKNLNKWKTNNEAETVLCQEKLAIVCVFSDAGTCIYNYFLKLRTLKCAYAP